MLSLRALGLAAFLCLAPATALAWGNTGHRLIGVAAMQALPAEIPAFLRTRAAALDLGELSREPDRSKDAGKVHDSNRDPGHFLDLDDAGRLEGGPPFSPLPPTRADYETLLRSANLGSWKAGYLPYSIIEEWQQLAKDLAYWRSLAAAEKHEKSKTRRAWYAADRARREALVLATLGRLSHFVGDGGQPLHVSVHYNGWGDHPNPGGYTNAKIHSPFESAMVHDFVTPRMVSAKMAPFRSCACAVEARTVEYLTATNRLVEPLYALEKAGGFARGDPRGPAFAAERLGAAASELRDLIVEAWRASAGQRVGWTPVSVADIEAGRIDPWPNLTGID